MGRCASQVLAGKRLAPSKGVMYKIKGFVTKPGQGSGKSKSILELNTESHYHCFVLRRQEEGESPVTLQKAA